MKELPGPQNLQQWLVSWRVFKAACICLNIVTLAALQLYEKVIEKLVIQWPRAWGLIAQADDEARAEKLEKIRRSIVLAWLQERFHLGSIQMMNHGQPASGPWHSTRPSGMNR